MSSDAVSKKGHSLHTPEWRIQKRMEKVKKVPDDLPSSEAPACQSNWGGKEQPLISSFVWKTDCICAPWGLVSCSHRTEEFHLDVFPLRASTHTFSHFRQILSPHFRAGKSSWVFFAPFVFLQFPPLPLKPHRLYDTNRQAHRGSLLLTFIRLLLFHGPRLHRTGCCRKHKEKGWPLPSEGCRRVVGRRLESMWKPQDRVCQYLRQ